jgi:hypothetical protein
VGDESGATNTTGDNNVCVGYQSAKVANATAINNTFIGYQSGLANITGHENVIAGSGAGVANTSGDENIFIGYQAAAGNTTADFGVCIGYQSCGGRTTTHSYSTVVGHSADGATTGQYNSYFGQSSGAYNKTGSNNIFSGYQSGYGTYIDVNTGFNNNTGIGFQAGYSLSTNANDNIFLGYKAGYNVTNGTGNINIGINANPPTAGTSNYLNIGNAIYGSMLAESTITFVGGISVDSIIDRCKGPKSKEDAYKIINSIVIDTETGKVKLSDLDPLVRGYYRTQKQTGYETKTQTYEEDGETKTREYQSPTYIEEEKYGRDLGMLISALVEAVKDLKSYKMDKP